jgi:phage shock protein C
MLMNRRLFRCRHNKMLAGVAGGVAEYFDLDPSLVRILFVISIFFGGIGLLLYIGMAIIVPLEPASADATGATDAAGEATTVPEGHRHPTRGGGRGTMIVGLALVLFGTLAFLHSVFPGWVDLERYLVPAFIVGIGALLVASAVRREPMET